MSRTKSAGGQFGSVTEMLKSVTKDAELVGEFESYRKDRQLVSFLASSRSAKGMSQEDIATAMGCSQSAISKLESGVDAELKIDEVDRYMDALGLKATVLATPKNGTSHSHIRALTTALEASLNELKDSDAAAGPKQHMAVVAQYETLSKLVQLIRESVERLPVNEQVAPAARLAFAFDGGSDAGVVPVGR